MVHCWKRQTGPDGKVHRSQGDRERRASKGPVLWIMQSVGPRETSNVTEMKGQQELEKGALRITRGTCPRLVSYDQRNIEVPSFGTSGPWMRKLSRVFRQLPFVDTWIIWIGEPIGLFSFRVSFIALILDRKNCRCRNKNNDFSLE